MAASLDRKDVLSELLAGVRLEGSVYFCDQVAGPWEKSFSDPENASFHQVRQGECWFESDDCRRYMRAGDVVFVKAARAHRLNSEDPATQTLLLCGYCSFGFGPRSPASNLLPEVGFLTNQDISQRPWLRMVLDQLSAEYMSPSPGAGLAMRRLTEVLIIELIRASFGDDEPQGFFRALSDKRIGAALEKMHRQPEIGWTLEKLGADVGMSRAGFARRFTTLVGQPMFDYLSELRIARAREYLLDRGLSLQEVADRVGYDSVVAFSKTFKKRVGQTPSQYRKGEEGKTQW